MLVVDGDVDILDAFKKMSFGIKVCTDFRELKCDLLFVDVYISKKLGPVKIVVVFFCVDHVILVSGCHFS